MISAISKYMPRWLMAIIATALVLATLVGSSQDSAEAIDPADTDTVYIADGTNFADALMGATIAALNTSPMLGVAGTNSGDTIPGDTVDELDRLTNDKNDLLDTIFIFGGTAAVSANVETQLGQWANNVQRIEGDSRWGTYQAISQMLPSAIDEAIHAQEADHATTADSATEADNADTLDGMDSGAFALSDQACASGDVVTGVAADGTVTCAADDVDGGDADTVDGINSDALKVPHAVPAGRSMSGGYYLDTEGDGSGDHGLEIDFPIPLATAPTDMHFVLAGGTPPPECPGDVSNPEAEPGHLCIYESSGFGYDPASSGVGSFDLTGDTDRFGGVVLFADDGTAGDLFSVGRWAVTAPESSGTSSAQEMDSGDKSLKDR